MFSSVRQLKCHYKMWRGVTPANVVKVPCPDQSGADCRAPISARELAREHHIVWINLLKRGRLSVIDQLARWECARPENMEHFHVELLCPDPLESTRFILVQSPQVNLCESSGRRAPHAHSLESEVHR